MRHTLICGAGQMGLAIGWAMKYLGHSLSVVDKSKERIAAFHKLNGVCPAYENVNQIGIDKYPIDIVISALPYHATLGVAKWAVYSGLRYCDLGGSVPVSREVNEVAAKAKLPVMTDLGLAPGWVNLVAEQVYAEAAKWGGQLEINMAVGGIPRAQTQVDPLNYKVTWSIDGLLNEYRDECEVLLGGQLCQVSGMSGLTNINVDGYDLEMFYTSGASAHSIPLMKKRGVSTCTYRTLRWRGHCRFMQYLMGFMNDQQLADALKASGKHHPEDIVIMYVEAKTFSRKSSKVFYVRPGKGFTAMQRATAFPTAAVADIMADGELDGGHPVLTYDRIPLAKFDERLSFLLK